jgi:hypothetical protein
MINETVLVPKGHILKGCKVMSQVHKYLFKKKRYKFGDECFEHLKEIADCKQSEKQNPV